MPWIPRSSVAVREVFAIEEPDLKSKSSESEPPSASLVMQIGDAD